MATLFSCTFFGFAPGISVGVGAAFEVYTGWGCIDLVRIPLLFTARLGPNLFFTERK